MGRYIIEIEEEPVKEQISRVISTIVGEEIEDRYGRRSYITPMIEKMVKELVYAQKDKIIEMVVDRATREIVKKSIPKLLENFSNGG